MNPFACLENPVRNYSFCPEDSENGRIRHIALVEKSVVVPKTGPEAEAAIKAAEIACKAFVIRDTNGTYDGGTAKTGKGRGSTPTRVTGRAHSITFADFEAVKNVAFWNAMTKLGAKYNFYYWTSTQAWPVEGTTLDISPKLPITDDAESEVEGEITVSWSKLNYAIPFSSDMSVLSELPSLVVNGLETVVPGAQTINALTNTVTVATAAQVRFDIDVVGAEAGFELKEGFTMPAGLVLDKITGRVSGVAGAVAPAAQFVVIAKNACGIRAEVLVTYVVTAA